MIKELIDNDDREGSNVIQLSTKYIKQKCSVKEVYQIFRYNSQIRISDPITIIWCKLENNQDEY